MTYVIWKDIGEVNIICTFLTKRNFSFIHRYDITSPIPKHLRNIPNTTNVDKIEKKQPHCPKSFKFCLQFVQIEANINVSDIHIHDCSISYRHFNKVK